MSIVGAVGGAACGVIIQLGANSLARNRYLARPWMHVLSASILAYVGYNLPKWEENIMNLTNEKRIERGMKPLHREDITVAKIFSDSAKSNE